MKFTYLIIVALLVPFCGFGLVGAITGTTSVCINTNTTLTDTTAGGTWSSGSTGVAVIGLSSGVVTGINVGTSVITYTIGGLYVTATLKILPAPAIDTVTGGGTYCIGGSGLPVGLSTSQSGANYFLHIGGSVTGPVPGSGTPIFFGTESVTGVYWVVAVMSATACTDTMYGTAAVAVSPLVTPAVSFSVSPADTICTGTSTTFTAMPVYGGSSPLFSWRVNGVAVGTIANTYTYVPASGDRVSVKLTSNAACLTTDSVKDTIIANVVPKVHPSVSLTVLPGDTVCSGYLVTVMPSPTHGGVAPIFGWMLNGTIIDSGSLFHFIPNNGDIVTCMLTSDYLCLIADTIRSAPLVMDVITPVIPSIVVNSVSGYVVPLYTTDTLYAAVSGGDTNLSYQWTVGTNIIPGATNDTFTYTNMDSLLRFDSISCTITSAGLCTISTTNWAFISYTDLAVINLNSVSDFNIYPNPSNGNFVIKAVINNGLGTLLTITGLDGTTVFQEVLPAYTQAANINLPGLPNGTYIISATSGGNTTRKVLQVIR